MIEKKQLSLVIHRLVDVYHPVSIYLFGSYAWGKPTDKSDLDVLIVVDKSDEPSYRRSVKGYHALFGLKIDAEILVRTKAEFEAKSSDVTTLAYKIKNDGKLLYGKP
jgi:predicted nucleotidyltransferase